MAGDVTTDDFYEDDEPVADVMRAFEGGERGVTRPPGRGWNTTLTWVNSQESPIVRGTNHVTNPHGVVAV